MWEVWDYFVGEERMSIIEFILRKFGYEKPRPLFTRGNRRLKLVKMHVQIYDEAGTIVHEGNKFVDIYEHDIRFGDVIQATYSFNIAGNRE